jgi:hypothetical protein
MNIRIDTELMKMNKIEESLNKSDIVKELKYEQFIF